MYKNTVSICDCSYTVTEKRDDRKRTSQLLKMVPRRKGGHFTNNFQVEHHQVSYLNRLKAGPGEVSALGSLLVQAACLCTLQWPRCPNLSPKLSLKLWGTFCFKSQGILGLATHFQRSFTGFQTNSAFISWGSTMLMPAGVVGWGDAPGARPSPEPWASAGL